MANATGYFRGMSAITALLAREVKLEIRRKHSIAGILMFVLSTVFICYLSFEKIESVRAWGALMWITGIFTAFNAMQKSFSEESAGTQFYLYTLSHPRSIIVAKTIYNAILVALLNLFSVAFFMLFFGDKILISADIPQFLLGLLLGSTGLGLALTFVAALAFKSGSGIGLVAILGFPVIVPLLITIVRHTTFALEGMSYSQNSLNLLILVVLNLLSFILSFILFPYLWRE